MSLSYTFNESVAGFRRNRTSTLISIFTVGISLLLLGVFTLITMNLSSVVDDIRSRVEIEAFLHQGLTQEQNEIVARAMRAVPGVLDIRYISKEEAAEIFRQEIGEDVDKVLGDNPLPPSFRVTIADGWANTDSVRVIAAAIEKMKAVESVVYRKQFLTLIDRRARAFTWATLFIGVVLALSAVILVANTIRLTIEAKREIIRTMKLVGATSGFIRTPFLLEGALHGLAGGIAAALLLDIVFRFFITPLAEDLLVSISIGIGFHAFLVLLGSLLGLVGSIISVRRFLRETLVASA